MHVLIPAVFFQVAAASDTLITRVVATELSTLQKILAFAEIGLVVLAYALVGGLLFAVLKITKTIEEAKDKLEDVRKDVRELVENGNKIVAKANGIVDTVKSSIDSVHETVETANQRARNAVSNLADRVDEFNNTLTIVQTETQDAVGTALAAIKGVKAGLGAFTRRKRTRATVPADDLNGDGQLGAPVRPRLKRRVHVET
jgi:uncharacterized protein YoxC